SLRAKAAGNRIPPRKNSGERCAGRPPGPAVDWFQGKKKTKALFRTPSASKVVFAGICIANTIMAVIFLVYAIASEQVVIMLMAASYLAAACMATKFGVYAIRRGRKEPMKTGSSGER
ncbi:MAG: hypothetical protein NTW19_15010, partial [Planctomycetota bacterium]|nr:hypothetical protein [Planctomycetota bacterium]